MSAYIITASVRVVIDDEKAQGDELQLAQEALGEAVEDAVRKFGLDAATMRTGRIQTQEIE
jgi:hypothetical protein